MNTTSGPETDLTYDALLRIAENDETLSALSSLEDRSALLPALFRVRGVPYSLQDYPQFKVFYSKEYVNDFIVMSARQCGKSQNLSISESLDAVQIPHFQRLYVAPLSSQTQRYSSQCLHPAINSCEIARYLQGVKLDMSDSKVIKAVFHASFANGAGIQLGYAKTSADRLRGITADALDFDEIQDQVIDNIPIIKESLTTSSWKVCRYTGTAKTRDNTIERLFQQSSMSEWGMRCGCGHWNIPDDEEDCRCLRMIRADGLHCLKCGSKLNAREGQWVAKNTAMLNKFRGYHISQVILPANLEDPRRWASILDKLSKLDITTVKNEVLGISSSTGVRIITPDDIAKNSVLPSRKDMQTGAWVKKYAHVFSGVDWGGAERTSFTVHVVCGITQQGEIHVLYARRYAGFDPDSRLRSIAIAHKMYCGCGRDAYMAADFGMGFDLNVILQTRYGIPVVQMQFLANQKAMMNWSPRQGYPCWSVNKLLALQSMFLAIKVGRFKFPAEEGFKLYTEDLLSPYEEVVDRGFTEQRQYTRDPSRPDDFAMALCFLSMMAWKVIYKDITAIIPDASIGISGASAHLFGSMEDFTDIDPAEILNMR